MSRDSSLDQRFARFCRTGEPAALGEVFDGTARELLHVAVWLAGNRADAEDLLQRTFLAAIETRAKYDPRQPVRPWLIGLLATEARHLRRERARRAPPSPLPSTPDPEAEAAAAELDAAVRAVREQLSEPYRDVLRLHLEEGLNAREIAERLGRPAGTVRTQLVRALDLLRQRLPSGFVAGLAPLTLHTGGSLQAVRSAVLEQARQGALPLVGAGSGTLIALASMKLSKKLVAVVPLLAFGVLLFSRGQTVEPPATVAPPPVRVANDSETASLGSEPARIALADAGSNAPTTPTTGSVRVRLRWRGTSQPAAGVGIAAWPERGHRSLYEQLALTDVDGECLFEAVPPGTCTVSISLSGNEEKVEVRAGATEDVELTAHRRATLRGLVTDEFEHPVADAEIWLSAVATWAYGFTVAHSDARGRFETPVGVLHYVSARKAGYSPSNQREVKTQEGETLELQLQLGGSGSALRGRVVDADRKPIAGARVLVGSEHSLPVRGPRSMFGESRPRGTAMTTHDDGTFTLSGIEPGETEIRAWANGYSPAQQGSLIEAGGTTNVELLLAPAATLSGVVRDGAGQPIGGADVYFGHHYEFVHATTTAKADGSYLLTDLPEGLVEVFAAKGEELRAKTRLHLDSGATTTWDPVLDAGRVLSGVVLDERERPLPDIHVHRQAWQATDSPGFVKTDAEGRFNFTNVVADATHVVKALGKQVALPPGVDEVVIRITETDRPTASVRLRLVDAAGHPVSGRVSCSEVGSNEGSYVTRDESTGVDRVEDLRPGRYELTLHTATMAMPLPTVDLHPGEQLDLGAIVVPEAATLRLRVLDPQGQLESGGFAQLVSARGQSVTVNAPQIEHGEVELAAPPGQWLLLVNGRNATAASNVVLEPGSTRTLTVQLTAARNVPLTLTPDEGVFAIGMFRLLARDADDHLARVFHVFTNRDGSITASVPLPPGDYRLEAIGVNSHGESRITVPKNGNVAPVNLRLAPR